MVLYFSLPIVVLIATALATFLLVPPTKKASGRSCYENRRRDQAAMGGKVAATIITVLATVGFLILFYRAGTSGYRYKEIWAYKVVSMEHWEKWTEEESYTVQVPDGTDSKGNTTYRTETRYRTVTRGPYWYKIDQYGHTSDISSSEYESWKNKWKNEKYVKTNIGDSAGFDTKIDGDVYEINWTGKFEDIYTVQEIKTYWNVVRGTVCTFSYRKPTEKERKRFPRPADTGETVPVISYGGGFDAGNMDNVTRLNTIIGPNYQCRLMFLCFNSDKDDIGVVESVLASWDGPNKNELVVFLGMKGSTVEWCSVQSWLDDTTIHTMIETELTGKKLTFDHEWFHKAISKNWKRKEFTKDFDYIQVQIPFTYTLYCCLCIIATYIVAIIFVPMIVHKLNK